MFQNLRTQSILHFYVVVSPLISTYLSLWGKHYSGAHLQEMVALCAQGWHYDTSAAAEKIQLIYAFSVLLAYFFSVYQSGVVLQQVRELASRRYSE